MGVGRFPVFKLVSMIIVQIGKPIVANIKNYCKKHPVFKEHVIMRPAGGKCSEMLGVAYSIIKAIIIIFIPNLLSVYNWMEVKTKMWALNLGKPVNVPPLNEAMAIELGANLLGEAIIFAIGAGVLIFEYARFVDLYRYINCIRCIKISLLQTNQE